MEVFFNFYGVLTQVTASDPRFYALLDFLKDDFEYFHLENNPKGDDFKIRVQLKPEVPPVSQKFCIFKTRMCRVYGIGRNRICDYGNGTLVASRWQGSTRSFVVTGDPERSNELYEVTYLALLSAVGEELDLLGYHRVHALGINLHGNSVLVLLRSGGGKSAMASLLFKKPGISIYSDEMPLIKKGVIYPFPIRIALHPDVMRSLSMDPSQYRLFVRKVFPAKSLIPIPKNQVSSPAPLSVLFGGASGKKGSVAIQLFSNLVVGLGLCQMAEHMIRTDNVFRIIRIGTSRFREALRLLVRSKRQRFAVTPDAVQNSRTLEAHFSLQD